MSVIELPVQSSGQEQLEGLRFQYDDIPGQAGRVVDFIGTKKIPTTKDPGHGEHVDFMGKGKVVGCQYVEIGGAMVKVLRVQVLDMDIV